ELVQLAHDCFTNHRARDFLLTAFLQRLLDAVGGLLDGRDADRPFLARLLQTGDDLETVEQLAAAVLLDHHRQHPFDPLVRPEASFAVEALAPPTNHPAVFGQTRVDDAVLQVMTEGALHDAFGTDNLQLESQRCSIPGALRYPVRGS